MTTSTKLVTVLKCSQVWEAEIIRERLEAAGLIAFVQGGETATSLSYVGVALGGVRVQVPSDQADRARQVLDEDERQRETAGPWKCPRCNEPNGAGFDFCYSCTMPRGDTPAYGLWDADDDEREERPEDDGAGEGSPQDVVIAGQSEDYGVDDRNPYRFVGGTVGNPDAYAGRLKPVTSAQEAEQLVSRAFRWAVVGVMFPMPVFHLISLGVLTQASAEGALRLQRLRRKFFMVLAVDILLLVVTSLLIFAMFFGW